MNAMAQNQEHAVIAGPPSEWGVLTCYDAATLRLADTLKEAGYEAWAPRSKAQKRLGRNRNRESVVKPVMPGFVFVAWHNVWLLAQMAYSPSQQFQVWDEEKGRMVGKTCPFFTVMRHEHNRQPVQVHDRGLDSLRMHEQAARPAEAIRLFDVDDEVRYPAAGFEGLPGIVQASNRKHTLVAFPGKLGAIKIPTALLISETPAP